MCRLTLIQRTLPLLAIAAVCGAPMAEVRQLALVVGINQYQHGDHPNLPPLKGAINDARVVAKALRGIGADLPERRLLLDKRATRRGFEAAWRHMIEQARTGDTLILTFAGHGGQETEFAEPFDEAAQDARDETLMFWDFDPTQPHRGRINDDELYGMLKQASRYRILFVADSCHSGGLTRGSQREYGTARGGNNWPVDLSLPDLPAKLAEEGEDWDRLDHVTFVTGTENDHLKVWETEIDGRPHGALSWTFAQAIAGGADLDGNGAVSRREMESYIAYHVPRRSKHRQIPRFLPRDALAGGQGLLEIASVVAPEVHAISAPVPESTGPLAMAVEGGRPPGRLRNAYLTGAADLLFHIQGRHAQVFHGRDRVARINTADPAAWQRLIDKYRLLAAIDLAYNDRQHPVDISIDLGDKRHRLGTRLNFNFTPGESAGHDYFVLFDLAGDGTLQYLYPLPGSLDPSEAHRGDPQRITHLPYRLPLRVDPPVGADDLVALFCRSAQPRLIELMIGRNGRSPPTPEAFLGALDRRACQLGRHTLFTRE